MVFDLAGSLDRLGGDLELFRDLTEYFFADAPVLAERIAQAQAQGDSQQLQRAAHSLKGLASNFGAEQVMASAARLEELGRDGQPSGGGEAAGTLVELRLNLEQLLEQLAPYRRAPGQDRHGESAGRA